MPWSASSASAAARHSLASPIMTGTMWLGASITGSPPATSLRRSVAARSWWRVRSTALSLRWRTLASAPAAIAGGRAVVKMKPGAWLRTASTSASEAAM